MRKLFAFTVVSSVAFVGLSCLPMSSSASASSTSGAGKKNQTTNVHNTINNQVSPTNTQQQPTPAYPQQPANGGGSVRNFAVKSYDRIVNDERNGGGEHLNSLILLMENEGVARDEALPLIRRAIRKSTGNAEIFGREIENSL